MFEVLSLVFCIVVFDGLVLWFVLHESRDVERLRDEWRQYRKMRLLNEKELER